jgi:large subunit ribosomal protein L29
MKIQDVRKLSDEELQTELVRLQRRLFDIRSQAVTEKLEDPTMVTKARRDVARLKTIIRERLLQAASASA